MALDSIQKRIDWPLSSGVKSSGGERRELSVQFLKDRFVRVERNTGQEFSWAELKKELVSQELPHKEAVRLLPIANYKNNGRSGA